MKKLSRITVLLIAVSLLICCMAGCNSEKKQAELEATVHAALYGSWVYFNAEQNARYTYLIENGRIEQHLKITDDQGEEHDLSLGDSFSIRYKVLSENEIGIYTGLVGEDSEYETIVFEKPNDNTLILDGVTYTRYEEWIKTQQ